jgi:hypothetical protein
MNAFARALIFTALLLGGCRATRDVAVTSYHVTRGVAVGSYRVATAPVHYALKRHRDDSSTTTETTSSDVSDPGYPTSAPEVATMQPQPQPAREKVSRVSRNETAQTKPRSAAPRTSSAQLEFPTAKAVPDKPGYVVSPFDASGRYVDVSGYASGSKVKDPWTDKIFIVP